MAGNKTIAWLVGALGLGALLYYLTKKGLVTILKDTLTYPTSAREGDDVGITVQAKNTGEQEVNAYWDLKESGTIIGGGLVTLQGGSTTNIFYMTKMLNRKMSFILEVGHMVNSTKKADDAITFKVNLTGVGEPMAQISSFVVNGG